MYLNWPHRTLISRYLPNHDCINPLSDFAGFLPSDVRWDDDHDNQQQHKYDFNRHDSKSSNSHIYYRDVAPVQLGKLQNWYRNMLLHGSILLKLDQWICCLLLASLPMVPSDDAEIWIRSSCSEKNIPVEAIFKILWHVTWLGSIKTALFYECRVKSQQLYRNASFKPATTVDIIYKRESGSSCDRKFSSLSGPYQTVGDARSITACSVRRRFVNFRKTIFEERT